MDIILSGYGKMGREVEKAALQMGHGIVARLDQPQDWENLSPASVHNAVVIDFSIPSAVVDNIRRCFDLDLPVVVGTTGWNDKVQTIRQLAENEGKAIFFASNFSIGVNIMFEVTKVLSRLLNLAPEYSISIEETHHIHKLDSPSGTAIKLAETMINELRVKEKWVNRQATVPSELGIISFREDEIPGIHKVICESGSDRLTIIHEARDRSGFARGAVMAAEWLQGRKGFFEMSDMLRIK